MDPRVLAQVLRHLPLPADPNLLIGLHTSDDAAVYRLSEDTALIFTLDFFTPMVDDPYLYGQIAAANALSDIYAMGGAPLMALNIACFPQCLSADTLSLILQGGAAKVMEAGAMVVGGHTVSDEEPKYGLAVIGLVHPGQVWSNAPHPGEMLYLTKPLGSGILSTALLGEMLQLETCQELTEVMATLNKNAALAAKEAGVSAVTDITGFGLIGHSVEMARAGNCELRIWADSLPLLPETVAMAAMGFVPAGAYRNREAFADQVAGLSSLNRELADIVCDPQTSGGLLMSIAREKSHLLEQAFKSYGVFFACIGETRESPARVVLCS